MTAVRREGKPGRRKVARGAGTGMAALVALGLGCGCGKAVIRPENPAGLAAATPARLGPVPGVNEGNTFATDKLNGGLSTPAIERSGLARSTWNGWKVPVGRAAQAPPAPESLVLSTPRASAAGDGALLAGTTPAVPMPTPIPQPAAGGPSRPAGTDPLIDACRSTKIAPPLRRLAASGTGPDTLTAAVVEARTAPAPVAAEEAAGAPPVRETPPPAAADEARLPEPAEAPSPAPEPAEAPSPAPDEAPAPAPAPAPVIEPIPAAEPPAAVEPAPKAPQAPAAAPADPIDMPIELPPLDAEPAAATEPAGKVVRDAPEPSKIEMPRPVGGSAVDAPAPLSGTVPAVSTELLNALPLLPAVGETRAEAKPVDKTVERASRAVTIPMPSRPGTNSVGAKADAGVPPLTLPALP